MAFFENAGVRLEYRCSGGCGGRDPHVTSGGKAVAVLYAVTSALTTTFLFYCKGTTREGRLCLPSGQ